MKIYKKEGDTIQLIALPGEEVEKGAYLLIEDLKEKRGLIVQLIDIQFANIPGVLEDILRDVMAENTLSGEDYDPLQFTSEVTLLKDARILVCKIRGTLEDGKLIHSAGWLPSRTSSKITLFAIERFADKAEKKRPIKLGNSKSEFEIVVDAKCFDAKLNVVTGRKGTGKSHLSKLLVLSLTKYGAPTIVLDVNGEYVNLDRNPKGERNVYNGKVLTVTPRENFQFTLPETGLRSFLNMLLYALELPGTSARVFARMWHQLERGGSLTFQSLYDLAFNFDCHESVRDAIISRLNTIQDSGLFTDRNNPQMGPEALSRHLQSGGASVINMKNLPAVSRRMLVELLISKLTDLLSESRLKGAFLFAEEAHLYLRETYWDDIVTRMRHLGLFTTFITNQPDTIDQSIYRQVDNLFVFNFTNEHDLETISKVAKIDSESLRYLVKDLPAHSCLAVGDVVKEFPMVVGVSPLNVETMGTTRRFFDD